MRRSESEGDEHRASRLTARIGLGDRGHCRLACSLGVAVLPSGPYALIACKFSGHFYWNEKIGKVVQPVIDNSTSRVHSQWSSQLQVVNSERNLRFEVMILYDPVM